MQDGRPLLVVDIDGVLNPYDGPCPDGYAGHALFGDDEIGRTCAHHAAWAWPRSHPAPTLLIPIDPATGLSEVHVCRLASWARDFGLNLPPP